MGDITVVFCFFDRENSIMKGGLWRMFLSLAVLFVASQGERVVDVDSVSGDALLNLKGHVSKSKVNAHVSQEAEATQANMGEENDATDEDTEEDEEESRPRRRRRR